MTIGYTDPTYSFENSIALYDIPLAQLCKVFCVMGGGSLASSVINNANWREPAEVVGTPDIESGGMRFYGQRDYLSFGDFGELSSEQVVQGVVFKSQSAVASSGLVNIWSAATKSSDPIRRRILMASSGGEIRINTYPDVFNGTSALAVAPESWYIATQTIAASSQRVLRLHSPDGTVLTEATSTYQAGPLEYAEDVRFEIGNGGSTSVGGCLLRVAGLWSGPTTNSDVNAMAAYMALVAGLA